MGQNLLLTSDYEQMFSCLVKLADRACTRTLTLILDHLPMM